MKQVTGDWIQEHVEWLYGFTLTDWQLEDQLLLQQGGVYAFMYPTDFGKSMQLDIDTVLAKIRDPNSRDIIIKINDAAARETSAELAMKLRKAAKRYPEVEPMITWRGELPHNVGPGFWIAGADFLEGRNSNKSVRCYGLGSRDLQGKRGRTKIDDIITEAEARSEAHRATVDARLDLVLRTLEAEGLEKDGLWAMFGTPQYEGSPYERIPMQLRDAGIRHKVIRRSVLKEDGTPLMPSRVTKTAVHKATMSKSAYAATYDLKPYGSKRPTLEQVELLVKHRGMPIPRDWRDFREWLAAELELRYNSRDAALRLLPDLEYYVGWDPATTGDSAQAVFAKLQRHVWLLRTNLGAGLDPFEQSRIIGHYVDLFPDALVVLENNAEQKAFRDVHERERPQDTVLEHGTYRNKNHGPISIPSMMQEMIDGYFHVPWLDEEAAEAEFGEFVHEVKTYSLAAHPHILPAVWFGWYFSERSAGERDEKSAVPPGNVVIPLQPVRVPVLMPTMQLILEQEEDELKKRSKEAWGRVHESFR
jgi:hypothetical protein